MKNDKEVHDLFVSDPAKLYMLLKRPFPKAGVALRVEQHKQVERTADLTAVPRDPVEPALIFENHGRRDENLHSRSLVSAGLFLQKYPGRRCEVHLVYLTRSLDLYCQLTKKGKVRKKCHPLPCKDFAPASHYLDERLEELARTHPDSPLISVFFPLIERNKTKILAEFSRHYDNLKKSPRLPERAREKWCAVFQIWLMRALNKNSILEVEKMLTDHLPAIEETVWGKELIEIYTNKGKEEGEKAGEIKGEIRGEINFAENELQEFERLLKEGILPPEAHRRLVASTQEKLRKLREKAAAENETKS